MATSEVPAKAILKWSTFGKRWRNYSTLVRLASSIKTSASFNYFTRQSQVNRCIQFLHQDVIDFTPPLQGYPSHQPSRDASLPSAGGAQVILRGQRDTADCILSSWWVRHLAMRPLTYLAPKNAWSIQEAHRPLLNHPSSKKSRINITRRQLKSF